MSILGTQAWKRLRARVLREETVCHLCGHPLDYDAPPRSTYAPAVDHLIPRAKGGDPLDRANLRAAHYGCNSRKGKHPDRVRPRTSRLL
jgi:5-methylcytosine-specific restriction endonuclease McrA